MDRRDEELVYLRKAFRRERRAATGAWKFFFTVALLAVILLTPGGLRLLLPEHPVTAAVFWGARFVLDFFGWADPYAALPAFSNFYWILLSVAGLVLLVSVIMWIAGSRKLRRTDAYLSYRTLRAALRDEAEEN